MEIKTVFHSAPFTHSISWTHLQGVCLSSLCSFPLRRSFLLPCFESAPVGDSSPCPPGLSATSTTSSWTASWSLAPPVKTPTKAQRRAPTARALAQMTRRVRNARQRPGKLHLRVWHSRRANTCRGTLRTPGREPGCASCPKPSPGWRLPYPGYQRTPSSPNWILCAWRPATSRTSGRYWPTTNTKTDLSTPLTWWDYGTECPAESFYVL